MNIVLNIVVLLKVRNLSKNQRVQKNYLIKNKEKKEKKEKNESNRLKKERKKINEKK